IGEFGLRSRMQEYGKCVLAVLPAFVVDGRDYFSQLVSTFICGASAGGPFQVFRVAHVGHEGNELVAEQSGESLDLGDPLLNLLPCGWSPRGANDGVYVGLAKGAKQVGA